METRIDEIAHGIFRLSTYVEAADFLFNQFLIVGDEALLFHTGPRQMFPSVAAAARRVVPLERLAWVSYGHHEGDESGALNEWLAAAPRALVAVGKIGAMVTASDVADRAPRVLADGEVLDLGSRRVRYLDTPHVPHGWDAALLYEETSGTLLCGDLFTQVGAAPVLTEGDIVAPALAAEDLFRATALTPTTAPTIRRLAALAPSTLALMHGPAFRGDGRTALLDLADDYERRLRSPA